MKKYYGSETEKALKNFNITGHSVDLKLIYAYTKVKLACALANNKKGGLSDDFLLAIKKTVEEILQGDLDSQFVTDSIQGGAGTSINMNLNEVIAQRSTEILSRDQTVHPLDHINMSQSTNDTFPTAIRLLLLGLIDDYVQVLIRLKEAFLSKSLEFNNVFKVARTHLQDAVPITLGQEFNAYASFVKRDIERIKEVRKYLYKTNLGGTAVGTGLNSSIGFIKHSNEFLSDITGYPFEPAEDLVDATQNVDVFFHIASVLNISANGISKICNDLKLMVSGPRAGLKELIIPEIQKGSSIMPGKVNPVALEVVNQAAYQVAGDVMTASMVHQNGQFELNVMFPVFVKNIIEGFSVMGNAIDCLVDNIIVPLKANKDQCKEYFDKNITKVTALSKFIGYDKSAQVSRLAYTKNISIEEAILRLNIMNGSEMEKILSPESLVNPAD
jgi:aspartate ammonia-lyase